MNVQAKQTQDTPNTPHGQTRWRTTCARARHEVAETTVHGADANEACKNALANLDNDWNAWELGKRCGPTFVDTLERDDGTGWAPSAIPVPYTEPPEHKPAQKSVGTITVVINGGWVHDVHIPATLEGIEVRIEHDDVEGADEDKIERDDNGREYFVSRWP